MRISVRPNLVQCTVGYFHEIDKKAQMKELNTRKFLYIHCFIKFIVECWDLKVRPKVSLLKIQNCKVRKSAESMFGLLFWKSTLLTLWLFLLFFSSIEIFTRWKTNQTHFIVWQSICPTLFLTFCFRGRTSCSTHHQCPKC